MWILIIAIVVMLFFTIKDWNMPHFFRNSMFPMTPMQKKISNIVAVVLLVVLLIALLSLSA